MQIDDGFSPLVELATSRHNAFHTNEAAAISINARRLRRAERSGLLYNIHPRVWALPALGHPPNQLLSAATIGLSEAAAIHESAAWLHGWLPKPAGTPQVWVAPGLNARLDQVRVSRIRDISPELDICTVDNIRTLNKAATLCRLGDWMDPLIVEKCLDQFLMTESVSWLDSTLARLVTPTAKGPRVLADIRTDPKRVPGVADSFLERIVSKLANQTGLPGLVLQHQIEVEGQRFRLDLAWPELKLGIEVHSRSFHFGPGKEDADNVRDMLAGELGWRLVYVTYSQTKNPDEFVRRISRLAHVRAEQLGVTF